MRRNTLLPREHGAYAQLLAPLLAALIVGSPGLAAALLSIAACAAFLANEPLLVVLGHRGRRLAESAGAAARARLRLTGAIAISAGVAGLALAPHAIPAALLVALPVVLLGSLAWRRAVHSLGGELVAAIALPGASVPIAVAAGIPLLAACASWLAWSLGYSASVVAVHHVIERRRGPTPDDGARVTATLGATALAAVCGLWVALPLAVTAAVVAVLAPSPRYLRTIGFVLVGASVGSIVLGI